MSETITNAFKTLQTFILKKKISFKKLTSITCSNKVKTLKNKKQFVDPWCIAKKKFNLAKNINKITTVFWYKERHFTYTFYIQM